MNRRTRNLLLVLLLVGLLGTYINTNQGMLLGSPAPLLPSISPDSRTVVADHSASLGLDHELKEHIRHYIEGVSIKPEESSLAHAVQLDSAIGRPQISRGQYRDAYRTYQQVLAISYKQGSLMGIGIALTVMADISYRTTNVDEALSTALLAYKVAEAMKSQEEMGVVELSFARMLDTQDPSLSMMWLLRARDHLQNSRYKEDYVRALPSLAKHLVMLGDNEEASKVYAEAWEQSRVLGTTPTQQWTKVEVADAYAGDLIRAKRQDKAIEVLRATQSLFAPSERTTDLYTRVLHGLARSYAGLDDRAEAELYYQSAYANYELTRANEPGDSARARLDRDHSSLVDEFVSYYLRAGNLSGALAFLESNKARTLQDVFEDPSYKHVQEQWRAMERRQAQEMSELWEVSGDPLLPRGLDDRPRKYAALASRHDHERRQLQTSLQLKEMVVAQSLSSNRIEDLMRRLPSNTAVLSFFFRDKQVSVFAVTQESVQHIPLAVGAEECQRVIQQLRVTLTNPSTDLYREPAQWLFQNLVKPALRTFPKTVTTVIYSPDGLLSRIPLEVFMDGEHYLGERFAVYRVPSLRYATAIRMVTAAPARHGIVCVDPDISGSRLPFQQETGQLLKRLYSDRVMALVGKDCSESRLVAAIQGQRSASFLHIGAHGNFYPADAMDSSITLAPESGSRMSEQAWTAKAMATVAMDQVDLVTLSSCETGLTDPAMPRDVFGIGRALFFAGAKTIVAPLWAVHDRATAEFMSVFHRAYHRNRPAVEALQDAQRALMQNPAYRHPYYWSAFVLTGAAR